MEHPLTITLLIAVLLTIIALFKQAEDNKKELRKSIDYIQDDLSQKIFLTRKIYGEKMLELVANLRERDEEIVRLKSQLPTEIVKGDNAQ